MAALLKVGSTHMAIIMMAILAPGGQMTQISASPIAIRRVAGSALR
jgi:hypothetical protein